MEELLHRHLPPLVSPLPAVRLFEPTKSSAMHEIVRASFSSCFLSLWGSLGDGGDGGQATCSPCKSPPPARTLLRGGSGPFPPESKSNVQPPADPESADWFCW